MAKCWNCGADVPDQAKFCPICGKGFATTSTGIPQPAPPYNQGSPYPNQPGMLPPMQDSQLEKKVDRIHKLLLLIIVVQVLYLIFLFA